MKKFWPALLILVLLVGVLVRSKNFFTLPLDAHVMRQTDTECVAYFLFAGKANFFKPKACLMRPVSNIDGYFLLEIPSMIEQLSPIVILLAGIFTIGLLNHNHELIALKAAGISFKRIIIPLISGTLIYIFFILKILWVNPYIYSNTVCS